MAPLTRSARTLRSQPPPAPKAPEIINIDEDDENDEELMDDESMQSGENLDDESEDYDEEEGDQYTDEEMTDANGDHYRSDIGSGYPVLEPSLKSLMAVTSSTQGSPQLFTAQGAQEALHPLQYAAARVTRQIQDFAERLDQFKRKNTADEFQNIQAAYSLVEKYRDLAQETVEDLTTDHQRKDQKPTKDGETKLEEEMLRWQLEVDTWNLLLNLISIDDPASRASFQEGQQAAFQNLHRYSSDREIWEQFLGADQYATECVIAMRWLEETAKSGTSRAMDILITDMEAQADRGNDLWSHGWLYTKESIKMHKRARVWPQPVEPNDPAAVRSLLRMDGKQLVTQMDPDSVTRQKRVLQPQDEYYENATWMQCWKMIRQGENWTTIRKWAAGHLDSWRAVSLCGSSVDKTDESSNTRTPVDNGMTRLMNSSSQDTWRTTCAALARNPSASTFERAVYALLCGESEAAAQVCSSWDDFLYVYFNRIVLSRYQGFCKQFHRKLSHSPTTPVVFTPEPAGYADIRKFFDYLRGNEQVGAEARNPFRNLQAAILSKGYDSYFSVFAEAVSQVNLKHFGTGSIVPQLEESPVEETFIIAAEDAKALTVATHVYLIVQSLGYTSAETQVSEKAAILVAGYISYLEERKVFDTIPLYASLLPTEMCHNVFSKILIEIDDPQDKQLQIEHMARHGIDASAVLDAQWAWTSASVSSIEHSNGLSGYSRVVRRPDGTRVLMPPRKDLIGNSISEEDEKMIRSLEWLRSAGDKWSKISELGAWLYRKFFVAGNLAAARELSHRMDLATISEETFGKNIFGYSDEDEESLAEEFVPTSPVKSKRNSLHGRSHSGSNSISNKDPHETAYQQATRMYNLETLAAGFDSLERFAIVYDQISKPKRRRESSGAVEEDPLQKLTGLLEEVESTVGLIVEEWLVKVDDVDEEKDYGYIRRTYLPDLILDYHNVLYYASHSLDKPLLLTQCMTVAIWVANIPHLTRSFTEAKRMSELMDALALSSKAMVLTDPKEDRVYENGQTLGIWRVSGSEDDEAVFEPRK
ncbi:uncharacterized protein N7483_003297 [Penicillium malachiteum]|uniref:uncharacterized protein n=1 Tax=Penicillium malachiteum TaxID=1324776 RepID=UPI002548D6DE|nr:uncharacterized protein N7483_003297 [Penicillium malachiteum]KAJ5728789.1 hypothetical protein N7483_003297 [Penicillium malachiteum]